MDPELQIDVVSLGLIYDVKVSGSAVRIVMTLTFPGCPYGPMMVEQVRDCATKVEGIESADVEVTFDPPWKPPEDLRAMYGV